MNTTEPGGYDEGGHLLAGSTVDMDTMHPFVWPTATLTPGQIEAYKKAAEILRLWREGLYFGTGPIVRVRVGL